MLEAVREPEFLEGAARLGETLRARLDALAAEGVLAGTVDPDTVRFVTHKDVDDAGLDHAISVVQGIARGSGAPG